MHVFLTCRTARRMLQWQAAPGLGHCKLLQRCHCRSGSSSHHRELHTFVPVVVRNALYVLPRSALWRCKCTVQHHSHQVQLELLYECAGAQGVAL